MGFWGTWFLSKEEQQKRAYENLGKKFKKFVETKIALKEYTDKTVWVMDENELRQYCRLKGIKRDEHIQFVWLVLQGWTFGQISDKLGYSVDTLKDWSPVCKKKLGITDWNADKNDNTH